MYVTPVLDVSVVLPTSLVQNNHQSEINVRQSESLSKLIQKQQNLTFNFRKWVNRANEMKVDSNQQIDKMASIIRQQPKINSYKQLEIWLAYETTMLNIFTSQIMQKITAKLIEDKIDLT